MVATDLQEELEARDEDIVAASKSDLDITNAAQVIDFIRDAKPAIIVNCAAFTKVDEAETNEGVATAINGSAVEFLASSAWVYQVFPRLCLAWARVGLACLSRRLWLV